MRSHDAGVVSPHRVTNSSLMRWTLNTTTVAFVLLQDAVPETAGDYERLLVATPNDSLLWVKFMAFKLSLADVEVSVERRPSSV